MRLNNLPNEYANGFPDFDRTPKSVIAAIAVSFAALQTDEDFEKAKEIEKAIEESY